MTQLTATAAGTTTSRAPATSRLRVVQAAPQAVRHTGYGLLCAALVVAGLLVMLLLNTMRAEGSFVLSDLQTQADDVHARQVALESELAALSTPQALSAKAENLGMVPSPSTAVLRLSDAVVLGVAAGVEADDTFTVTMPAPRRPGGDGERTGAAEQGGPAGG